VTVDGWKMPRFIGPGTRAAFTKGGQTETMVMEDTVLFEDEVNPVEEMAGAARAVYDKIKEVRAASPQPKELAD